MGDSELSHEPDPNDPAEMMCQRVLDALFREFEGDDTVPRFALVIEMPEHRIGVAGTADDGPDLHRMFSMAAASVRNAMTPEERERARQVYDSMAALYRSRN